MLGNSECIFLSWEEKSKQHQLCRVLSLNFHEFFGRLLSTGYLERTSELQLADEHTVCDSALSLCHLLLSCSTILNGVFPSGLDYSRR
jgi:hypothetical protein